jgi:hypothetical protein
MKEREGCLFGCVTFIAILFFAVFVAESILWKSFGFLAAVGVAVFAVRCVHRISMAEGVTRYKESLPPPPKQHSFQIVSGNNGGYGGKVTLVITGDHNEFTGTLVPNPKKYQCRSVLVLQK